VWPGAYRDAMKGIRVELEIPCRGLYICPGSVDSLYRLVISNTVAFTQSLAVPLKGIILTLQRTVFHMLIDPFTKKQSVHPPALASRWHFPTCARGFPGLTSGPPDAPPAHCPLSTLHLPAGLGLCAHSSFGRNDLIQSHCFRPYHFLFL